MPDTSSPPWRDARAFGAAIALALAALSGAAALAWQVLWTAQLSAGLGHEIIAVLAVLAAFFGGIALGAQALGRRIAASRWPGRWYAGLEAAIAAWGLVLTATLAPLMARTAGLIGAEPSATWHWSVAFAVPLILLLPATAAMGATLPALERQLRGQRVSLGAVYSANTFGAVCAVLLTVFLLIPAWGLRETAWLCATTNGLCALLAWRLWGARPVSDTEATPPVSPESAMQPSPEAAQPTGHRLAPARLTVLLLATGTLGIGYEVLAVRVLSQVTENTVYSYAVMLAVYLMGTAAGAAIHQRLRPGTRSGEGLLADLLGLLAAAMLLAGASLWWADVLCAWPARWIESPWLAALAGEALAATAALLAPTLVMGALFTHLCTRAQAGGWPLGRALAINTVGAALAPILIGLWLVPALGARAVLAGLVLGYGLLMPRAHWRRMVFWVPAGSALALAVAGAPLRFIEVPEGGRLLTHRDGMMAAVSVVEDAEGIARLHINNRIQEGSSASGLIELRLAHLPLLMHAAPSRALFLGLGTGFTARAAAQDPALRVEAVELLPEVVEAAARFAPKRTPGGADGDAGAFPLRPIVADARRFVQAGGPQYDVIVADLFHPARNGAGALYTVEQFAAVRDRLAPGGLFCQWLAVHQMSLQTLRSIVGAFLQVYPEGLAVLASNSLDTPVVGLIGRPGGNRLDPTALNRRIARAPAGLQRSLAMAQLTDSFALPGSVLAGPAALRRFAGTARVNTDDQPRVVHDAPWDTYDPQSTPRQRLLALVAELQPDARELLRDAGGEPAARLQAYWESRRRYLEIGATVRLSPDPAAMLEQLQAPLLDLLRHSPDFRPAHDPLLALARAIEPTDAALAQSLQAELQAIRARRAPELRPTPPSSNTPQRMIPTP